MSNQIQDIISKRDDYRIKIFNLFYTTAKICKQFISQKCIRKIKQSKDKANSLGDSMDEVSLKLKLATDYKKNEKALEAIKDIKSTHLKALALHFILEIKQFNIEKQLEFFNKEFSGDYQTALNQLKEDLKNKDSIVAIYKRKFESHARYLQFLEQCDKIMGVVSNKLGKSKSRRQQKKEKLKLKKQNQQQKSSEVQQSKSQQDGEQIAEKEEQNDQNENQLKEQQTNEQKKQNNGENKQQKQSQKEIKQKSIQQKYDKLASKYRNDTPKERTEFKKKGKERKQQLKQEKFEKRQKTEKQEQENSNTRKNFKQQNLQEIDKLHPSWAARLQQQQQQQNLLQFQGKVTML
ncbi:hypothetical protein TTHERM_00069260 (macronuclear) [Tetrahymena thermophila SB210]|uniref:Uncharacterized protein n=1 Tax=Tetrahymena thermophila (strain SB210) TaxID=312017 RepID=I7MHG6_TETTS|nr:hypothetical protein TTHERM_00069260 [Tetrahymena thermophila SB210]EAR87519.1 hypothetical protein TTHERM_00069260 [Tetrahymena thermophila SB210]|eukprot:XP_001007764.1 hypothetical protein TTHERM_00069260 [Tetrahymena thermophila SB210]